MEGAIAILNVSRMNDDVQQEAQRVDQDVPFATFDLLKRIGLEAGPLSQWLFSALAEAALRWSVSRRGTCRRY